MDRQEFSAMVKAARERKGVSKYQVHLDSRLTETQVLRIERAENAYNMRVIFSMLNALNMCLMAYKQNKYILSNTNDMVVCIKKMIGDNSRYSICKALALSQTTLKNTIDGNTTPSIDFFLKLTNYFGYTLSIVDKEEQA